MGFTEGRNGGVTGLLDLPGRTCKFFGYALGWESVLAVGLFDDAGRGDSLFGNKLPLSAGGTITLSGETRLDGNPLPDQYRGERGSLVLQQHDNGKGVITKMTVTVMVTQSSFEKPDKEHGLWTFSHVCQIVAAPSLTGYGASNTAGVQSYGDKQLWANLAKGVDPQGLASFAAQRWRVWGIGDDDASELAKINSLLGGLSAPFTGMKQRVGSFSRLSANVALIDVRFGLTDTAEDWINPRTQTTLDANHLASTATVAAINGTPASPTGDTFVKRTERTEELNDAKIGHLAEYGLRDTVDDVTMPDTFTRTDPSAIDSSARKVEVYTTLSGFPADPTPPAGLQLVGRTSREINRLASEATFDMEVNSSVQKITFPQTRQVFDANEVEAAQRAAQVYTTIVPADPSPPAGQKLRTKEDVPITASATARIWSMGKTDTKDDVEMPHTLARADSFLGNAADTASLLAVTGSNTAAALAATQFVLRKSTVGFESLSVKKLSDDRALLVVRTHDDQVIVDFQMRASGKLLVPAYYDGSHVFAYLRNKHQYDSDRWQMELAPQPLYGSRMRFTIHRYFSGGTLPMHWDLTNTTNNSTFLGLSAGFCTYLGIDGASNISVAASRVSRVAFQLLYDTLGIFDNNDLSMGWQWTTTDLSGFATPAWTRADLLGFSPAPLTGGDYSPFTTVPLT